MSSEASAFPSHRSNEHEMNELQKPQISNQNATSGWEAKFIQGDFFRFFPYLLIFYPKNTTVCRCERVLYTPWCVSKTESVPILGISRCITEVPQYSTPVSQKITRGVAPLPFGILKYNLQRCVSNERMAGHGHKDHQAL